MRVFAIVLLLTVLSAPSGSVSLGQPFPSPWFIEHVTLGSLDLPLGVSVDLVPNLQSEYPSEFIVIKNDSSTILYLIGTHGLANAQYADISVSLPPGIGPLNKLVDGRAYKWEYEFDDSNSSFGFAWVPQEDYEHNDSVRLEIIFENRITTNVGTLVFLEPLNRYDGDRPADVNIPGPQETFLSMIYGTEELEVPLTISYTLNADYHPYRPSLIPDSLSPEMLYCVFGIGLLLAMALVWLFVWIVRKKAQQWR